MRKDTIDFVLIWVDGNDPKWQTIFMKYKENDGDKRPLRFRDMGTLRYWFRGVEKFAPWVNKVYFVTCGQRPNWLNTANPKLVCVRHDEFIPEKYLPTFSSHTIEFNLHRIPGLSEQFVYFNDDMFLIRETYRKDFFVRGLPCDKAVMSYNMPVQQPLFLMPIANAALLNRHFHKKTIMLRYFDRFFSPKYGMADIFKNIKHFTGTYIPGFHSAHLPNSFSKSTFDEVWAVEPELLDSVCSHRFRAQSDINQWALQGWQYCTGRFYPRRYPGQCFYIRTKEDAGLAAKAITDSRYKMICLNDEVTENFERVKLEFHNAFEKLLPEKSHFER